MCRPSCFASPLPISVLQGWSEEGVEKLRTPEQLLSARCRWPLTAPPTVRPSCAAFEATFGKGGRGPPRHCSSAALCMLSHGLSGNQEVLAALGPCSASFGWFPRLLARVRLSRDVTGPAGSSAAGLRWGGSIRLHSAAAILVTEPCLPEQNLAPVLPSCLCTPVLPSWSSFSHSRSFPGSDDTGYGECQNRSQRHLCHGCRRTRASVTVLTDTTLFPRHGPFSSPFHATP